MGTEKAFSFVPDTSDYLLPPEDFVQHTIVKLGLSNGEITAREAATLVRALHDGLTRIEVAQVLATRRYGSAARCNSPTTNHVLQNAVPFLLLDALARYAPEDDDAFLTYAYERILARQLTALERVRTGFDLRRKILTRQDILHNAVSIAQAHGSKIFWDTQTSPTMADSASPPATGRVSSSALHRDADGAMTFVICTENSSGKWTIADGMWWPEVPIKDGAWQISEGWVLLGPKRSFPTGEWRLDLDLQQTTGSVMEVDVIANSGLDTLLTIRLEGAIYGGFRFVIQPQHFFLEVRIKNVSKDGAPSWFAPRNVALVRVD